WALCSPVNAERTVHRGVEAGLDAALVKGLLAAGDRLELAAAYTWNDFRFDGDPLYGDNRLPGVPVHHLRAELLYRNAGGFFAGPGIEWSPRAYFADNANGLTVPAYALLHFSLGADLSSNLSVHFEARNLTDARYVSTVAIAGTAAPDSQLFNPGTG